MSNSAVVNFVRVAALLLLVAACAFVAVRRLGPPAAAAAEIVPTEFSSGRAMRHLRIVAQQPRPPGSRGHAEAREYIRQELARLGLGTELQTTPLVNNVLARLAGSGRSGKAILLVGHYDTVADSPGAGDDGSAVAVLLETLRALKAAPPLGNDVIALFSDGEEAGLLGAKAFVYGHPWAKEVGVVLNFDARGSGGPAIMFETSGASGALVRHLAAAPHPIAYSLTTELYKLMPNDTDLSAFKAAGLPGLNFAFIKNGATHYHGPLDNLDNLDERSVQHQGSYALSLARRLGDSRLDDLRETDAAVYFNLFGSILVVYPAKWGVPLAGLAAALVAVAGFAGGRAKRLDWAEVGKGLAAVPACVLAAVLGVKTAGWVLGGLAGRGDASAGGGDDAAIMLLTLVALACACAVYVWCGKRAGGAGLIFGGLLWWLVLLLLTCVFWPVASYLFAWPLLLGAAALALGFAAKDGRVGTTGRSLLLALGALAGVALFAPVVYLTLIGFGSGSTAAAFVLAAPAALVLVLLVPFFPLTHAPRERTALS